MSLPSGGVSADVTTPSDGVFENIKHDDTVDVEISVRSRLDTGGHRGSAVINGKVTELVDMARAVAGLDPALFGEVSDMVGV